VSALLVIIAVGQDGEYATAQLWCQKMQASTCAETARFIPPLQFTSHVSGYAESSNADVFARASIQSF
jgi:hypothetical protein